MTVRSNKHKMQAYSCLELYSTHTHTWCYRHAFHSDTRLWWKWGGPIQTGSKIRYIQRNEQTLTIIFHDTHEKQEGGKQSSECFIMHNENRTEIAALQRNIHLAMTHLIAPGLTHVTVHGPCSPNNINIKAKDTLQQLMTANKRAEREYRSRSYRVTCTRIRHSFRLRYSATHFCWC